MSEATTVHVIIQETKIAGFFDMFAMGAPLRDAIAKSRIADGLSGKELDKSVETAFRHRMERYKDAILKKVASTRPWLRSDHVMRRDGGGGRHCLHADLLQDFATIMYSTHDVHIDQDRLAKLRSQAPKLAANAKEVEADDVQMSDAASLQEMRTSVRHAKAGVSKGFISVIDVLEKMGGGRQLVSSIRKKSHINVVDKGFANEKGPRSRKTPCALLEHMIKIVNEYPASNDLRKAQIVRNLRDLMPPTGSVPDGVLMNTHTEPDPNHSDTESSPVPSDPPGKPQFSNTEAPEEDASHDLVIAMTLIPDDGVAEAHMCEDNVRFSVAQLFNGLPEHMRAKTGAHAWKNTSASLRNHLGLSVLEGDIKTHVNKLNDVMVIVVKGHGQKIHLDMSLPHGATWTRKYVLRHHKRVASLINGQVTQQQVMDAIRRVPDFVKDIGGYASVIDFIAVITQKSDHYAARVYQKLECTPQIGSDSTEIDSVQEVHRVNPWPNLHRYEFPAQGPCDHPVAPFRILMRMLPYIRSRNAADIHAKICDVFCRVKAGDQAMHAVIDVNQASMGTADRQDVLREVPDAAPILESERSHEAGTSPIQSRGVVKRVPTQVNASSTIRPIEELVTESGFTVRLRRRVDAGAGVLGKIEGLDSIVMPICIAGRPGCYVGVKGRVVTESGDAYWWIKVGVDWSDVEARPEQHADKYPFWITLWAGKVTSTDFMPDRLEDKLKSAFRKQVDTLVVEEHKREEFLIPEITALETIGATTRELERTLSTRVVGVHALAGSFSALGLDKAENNPFAKSDWVSGAPHLEVAREQTKQSEHAARQAEHGADRAWAECMKCMAANGFTFEQIQALRFRSAQKL